jgi:uncharacterized protein YidB (DUF937 family)
MGFLDTLVSKISSTIGIDLQGKLTEQLQSLLQPETIQALVTKADETGLGDKVRSWIGQGENLPVTPDELRQLLGNSEVENLVAKTGLPADALLTALTHFLPAAVDHKTPTGEA